jgi:hypothetical protein
MIYTLPLQPRLKYPPCPETGSTNGKNHDWFGRKKKHPRLYKKVYYSLIPYVWKI